VSEPAFVTKTRASFDAVAGTYAATFSDELAGKPLDRALLSAFAELVPAGPVVDVGCGPGYVTAHLASLGLDVSGIDLSPGMVEVARRAYPSLPFSVGSMLALELADGSVAGLIAYYSIVNIPRQTVYSLETVGDKPSLRFIVNVTHARTLFPRDSVVFLEAADVSQRRQHPELAAALRDSARLAHTLPLPRP